MKINRSASLNAYFQVSQAYRPMPKFGVNLHYSCKESSSHVHLCAIASPDGTFVHVDMRAIPNGAQTSLISHPLNAEMAEVPTHRRLEYFESLLNNNFRTIEELLRHAKCAHPEINTSSTMR